MIRMLGAMADAGARAHQVVGALEAQSAEARTRAVRLLRGVGRSADLRYSGANGTKVERARRKHKIPTALVESRG
jgi:hypothetical protein